MGCLTVPSPLRAQRVGSCMSNASSMTASAASSSVSCVTFEDEEDCVCYYTAPAAAAAWDGSVRPGMRVVLKAALVEISGKAEHLAGSAGRVWALREDGVMVVAVDNDAAALVLVGAEAHDVEVGPEPLPVGTKVCGFQVLPGYGVPAMPRGTVGEVLGYDEAANACTVAVWSHGKKVTVPMREIQPAPAEGLARLAKRAASFVKGPARLRTASSHALPAAASAAVANLLRTPEYSSLRGSTRGTYRAVRISP
eukprot:TRINITY_DN1427_c1_g1_i1.p1 TRINITY_DN1427_c1_g1~~TRINITY_DN1427_c1_g1_i1.p1  ORF type:complete len:253 (+),score=51.33 TRINITY_DN1427_c1_g1_i1:52-810(+)